MEERISFKLDGLVLAGILHKPDDLKAGEQRGAFLVLHGFGSNKDEASSPKAAGLLSGFGYVTLRFDMRGCGDSEGDRGKVIYDDQIQDTLAALEFMAGLAEVEPGRIAAVGASYGAAVAVHAASQDKRLAAVIASGGWGNGDRTFHALHPTEESW
ncbi:MAG: alpha/beta fold hydrolase, partial [Rhodospirillales bacterium]|nr:alpha/beta fold hydrolase [Rhodospirillales bacterium]